MVVRPVSPWKGGHPKVIQPMHCVYVFDFLTQIYEIRHLGDRTSLYNHNNHWQGLGTASKNYDEGNPDWAKGL